MGTGGTVLFWALRKYLSYNMARIAAADAATRTEISDLRQKVVTLETAQDDMVLKHATDRQQWEVDRDRLKVQIKEQAAEIEKQCQSIKVLETAYKDSEKRAAALEARVTQLEAELVEKNEEIEKLRDRLHKAELAFTESKTEAAFYRTQNKELFDLLKRYQQVQLAGRPQQSSEEAA